MAGSPKIASSRPAIPKKTVGRNGRKKGTRKITKRRRA